MRAYRLSIDGMHTCIIYIQDTRAFYFGLTHSGEQHVVQKKCNGHDDKHQAARAPASFQELNRLLA